MSGQTFHSKSLLVLCDPMMLSHICEFIPLSDVLGSLQCISRGHYINIFNDISNKNWLEKLVKSQYGNLMNSFDIKWNLKATKLFLNKCSRKGSKNGKKIKVNRVSSLQQLSPIFFNWNYITLLLNKKYNKKWICKSNCYNISCLMYLGNVELFIHWFTMVLGGDREDIENEEEHTKIEILFEHRSPSTKRGYEGEHAIVHCKRNGVNQCLRDCVLDDDCQYGRDNEMLYALTRMINVSLHMNKIQENNENENDDNNKNHSQFLKLFKWILDKLTKNNTQECKLPISFYLSLMEYDNHKNYIETTTTAETTMIKKDNTYEKPQMQDIKLLLQLWELIVIKYNKTMMRVKKDDVDSVFGVFFGGIACLSNYAFVPDAPPFIHQRRRYNIERLYRLTILKNYLLDINSEYGKMFKQLFGYMNQFIKYNCLINNKMDFYYQGLKSDFNGYPDQTLAPQLYDIIYCTLDLDEKKYSISKDSITQTERMLLYLDIDGEGPIVLKDGTRYG